MTDVEGGMGLAHKATRAVADELGWPYFRSRPLVAALAVSPIYFRGTMNDWSTAAPFSPSNAGE